MSEDDITIRMQAPIEQAPGAPQFFVVSKAGKEVLRIDAETELAIALKEALANACTSASAAGVAKGLRVAAHEVRRRAAESQYATTRSTLMELAECFEANAVIAEGGQ